MPPGNRQVWSTTSEMAKRTGSMVIVGAAMTGGNAAVALREEGYAGRVVLLGDEPTIPFGRPPLSKTYLMGREDLNNWYVKPRDWYEANDVELMTGLRVEAIDIRAREVRLPAGGTLNYDGLLLATGGRNRRLQLQGVDLDGIYQLRTLAECDAIKAVAAPGKQAVVVGLGFIGAEVTASLTSIGVKVVAVGSGKGPLATVLGDQVAAVMAAIHREKGVELVLGDQVTGFAGTDRVEAVLTRNGRRLECDFVVIGAGIVPNVELPRNAGIAVDDGIVVDAYGRASGEAVFAGGDVANHDHPLFGRLRVEHYNNAEKMGRAVARTMLGRLEPYDYLHSFWSDQYEDKLEYVGFARRWDRFVVRGSLEERRFLGFYFTGGRLLAALGLNRGGDPELDESGELAACGRVIAAGGRVDPAQLEDERIDIRGMLV
jgi:3-phenylpropionate/trans-cinnamate dioxygenase ferredoxin reductase component